MVEEPNIEDDIERAECRDGERLQVRQDEIDIITLKESGDEAGSFDVFGPTVDGDDPAGMASDLDGMAPFEATEFEDSLGSGKAIEELGKSTIVSGEILAAVPFAIDFKLGDPGAALLELFGDAGQRWGLLTQAIVR